MTTIRAIIADDEALARKAIRLALERHDDVTIVDECRDGEEAAIAIERSAPDVLFIDVEMPRLDGLALAGALRRHHEIAVVFVTAYSSYALRAFDVEAVDFILKPFDRARIAEALERVRRRRQSHVPPVRSGRIAIFDRGTVQLLETDAIDYVKASDNYVELHGRSSVVVRTPLNRILGRLGSQFVRVHRSYAVNLDAIARVEPAAGGDARITLKSGEQLAVSRNYREELLRSFAR